jgi:eukaryotic-like serine/threonine-protein kinase
MSRPVPGISRFFGELKRRRVIRVAIAYAVVGWIIIQVSATVVPYLRLPDLLVTGIILVVALGLPLALVVSWVYDITPDGVLRTPSIAAEPAERVSRVGRADPADGRIRVIALPFHMLRPDSETGFLAFSLPDAVTSSLAGIGSLVVRSQLAAVRYGTDLLDLEEIAARAGVDVVLTGTLLRIGETIGITVRLTDVRDGTLLWSEDLRTELDDLFQLQERIARRIVGSLRLPLSEREDRLLHQDVPATSRAYEYYLRANEMAYHASRWATARDLYLQSVFEDPDFAPAWARLARCHRLLAKYSLDQDEAERNMELAVRGFERALQLNPDLSVAHNYYAQLEVDLGRSEEAMVRLLDRAHRVGAEAELLAGLVHACRFVGLLDASLAAHHAARRLDPGIPTSVSHTYWMLGEYQRVTDFTLGDIGYVEGVALAALGRPQEAVAILRSNEAAAREPRIRAYVGSLRALLEGEHDECRRALETASRGLHDAEGLYYLARSWARLGDHERAIRELGTVVERGFVCVPLFEHDEWLDPLRADPRFEALLVRARAAHQRADAAFLRAGGSEIVGGMPALTPYTAPT